MMWQLPSFSRNSIFFGNFYLSHWIICTLITLHIGAVPISESDVTLRKKFGEKTDGL